jgi:hypothetical protein
VLTVDDGKGGTSSDEVKITVADRTAPIARKLTAAPARLWPPNHVMVPVKVAASASDVCDPAPPSCRITGVTSNEPVNGLGDGDASPDWEITGSLTLKLRAERSGNGKGRVYTVSVTCSDAFQNRSTATVGVLVPHDQP